MERGEWGGRTDAQAKASASVADPKFGHYRRKPRQDPMVEVLRPRTRATVCVSGK